MKKDNYIIIGTRSEAAIYMAWEYGIAVAIEKLKTLKRHSGSLYIIPVPGPLRFSTRELVPKMTRIIEIVAHYRGKLGKSPMATFVQARRI